MPRRPQSPPAYALECLDALAAADLGHFISLGGAFGLAHYHEYRSTHDVDAWWAESVTREQKREVVQVLEKVLVQFGVVRVREWGDVSSVELLRDERVVFSFQIANRSVQLEPAETELWPGGIRVDSFDDLIASKMVALVNRGAPRDFLDIYEVCRVGKSDIATCWKLWQQRQTQADESADVNLARLAVRTPCTDRENAPNGRDC